MGQSTRKRASRKSRPAKPYADFPLFPHATGRWAKKIRQKLHYFGKIADDPRGAAALERLNREWPYLSEGRTPPPLDIGDICTVRTLCNSFLSSKLNKVESGELSERSFRDYHNTTDLLIEQIGMDRRVDDLRTDDFERLRKSLAVRLAPVSLKNEINRCRIVFKHAHDQRLIKEPVNYGQSFDRPTAKMIRKARNEAGPNLFERDELLTILSALDGGHAKPNADATVKAMVLLGLNCGFGNTDVATLPRSAVDLDSGWIDYPRPKTEIQRRVPLWPETVEALRAAGSERPEAKDNADADLWFLTMQGNRWVRVRPKKSGDDPIRFVRADTISVRFGRLLKSLRINGRRRLGFYTLRHCFETIGGESRDQVAVNAIMGHADDSMAAAYRERISDERLQAVVQGVRTWLWSPQT